MINYTVSANKYILMAEFLKGCSLMANLVIKWLIDTKAKLSMVKSVDEASYLKRTDLSRMGCGIKTSS